MTRRRLALAAAVALAYVSLTYVASGFSRTDVAFAQAAPAGRQGGAGRAGGPPAPPQTPRA